METRKLAYVYTGEDRFQKAFETSHEEFDSLMIDLEPLVGDNQYQSERFQRVYEIVNQHFSEFDASILEEVATTPSQAEQGNVQMLYAEQIQIYLEEMIQEENSVLAESNNSYNVWTFLIIVGIVSATFIVGLSLYNLIRKIRPLVEEVVETKENLEITNRSLNKTLEELHKTNEQKEIEIKARERAIRETEKLNDTLSAKNQQLDHFAYVASHDLQEPLRTVSNYLEIYQEDFPDKIEGEAVMYFDFINSAVDRMRNLISGLLSFSRLGTSGQVQRIDLNEIISKIKEDLSAVVEERSVTIESDFLPTIEGYRIEIKQLFHNLISNGIKFTHSTIAPHVKLSFDETDNFYNFHIKDNGIGIPNKDFEKIFDMFSRLHSAKDYEGQGIGLAFCKKIVELHQGNIWATSEFGEGTTIHFTIKK